MLSEKKHTISHLTVKPTINQPGKFLAVDLVCYMLSYLLCYPSQSCFKFKYFLSLQTALNVISLTELKMQNLLEKCTSLHLWHNYWGDYYGNFGEIEFGSRWLSGKKKKSLNFINKKHTCFVLQNCGGFFFHVKLSPTTKL